MFSITPFSAKRHVAKMRGDTVIQTWEPCKVLGITMEDGEPRYIVEIADDGEFYLTTVDAIRKCP